LRAQRGSLTFVGEGAQHQTSTAISPRVFIRMEGRYVLLGLEPALVVHAGVHHLDDKKQTLFCQPMTLSSLS